MTASITNGAAQIYMPVCDFTCKHTQIEPYYEHENNTGNSLNQQIMHSASSSALISESEPARENRAKCPNDII